MLGREFELRVHLEGQIVYDQLGRMRGAPALREQAFAVARAMRLA